MVRSGRRRLPDHARIDESVRQGLDEPPPTDSKHPRQVSQPLPDDREHPREVCRTSADRLEAPGGGYRTSARQSGAGGRDFAPRLGRSEADGRGWPNLSRMLSSPPIQIGRLVRCSASVGRGSRSLPRCSRRATARATPPAVLTSTRHPMALRASDASPAPAAPRQPRLASISRQGLEIEASVPRYRGKAWPPSPLPWPASLARNLISPSSSAAMVPPTTGPEGPEGEGYEQQRQEDQREEE